MRAVVWDTHRPVPLAVDDDQPDPDVCADCDHQRAFHTPCLGLDCTCGEFTEPTQNGAAA